jgi:hypothetical protein
MLSNTDTAKPLHQHLSRLSEMSTRIAAAPGSLKKKAILAEYPDLQDFIRYVYDPFKKFHITSKNAKKLKDVKAFGGAFNSLDGPEVSVVQFFNVLDLLVTGDLSGHSAIATVKRIIEILPQHEDIIYRIIDKDLEIRLGDTEINKVFEDLIPTFDVALAESYEPEKDVLEDGKWFISHKLDGCLHASTMVEFEDGSKETISNVVANKIDKKIKSFNHKTGKVEYKKIKNYMKDLDDMNENNGEWYEITLVDGRTIKLTGNHRVWIPSLSCYRRVDEMDGGEDFLVD